MSTEAQQFFEELEEFSARCRKRLGLDPKTHSPWGTASFHGEHPQGAILHYTADPDMQRVVRYFCDPRQNANASAHVVVGRGKEAWAQGLDVDLPLVRELPATVVQCRLPTEVAWHATWTNAIAYGIENINTGEIRKAQDSFVWWKPLTRASGEWTTPYVGQTLPAFGRFWEPYTAAQLTADIMVIRAVNALHGQSLKKHLVVGHENVQGVRTPGAIGHDKRDAGPHMPLHDVRMWAFLDEAKPADVLTTLQACVADTYCENWRARVGETLLGANGWASLLHDRALQKSPTVCKAMLYVLGYNMTAIASSEVSPDEAESIKVFQKMMGLPADGVLGEQTCAAIGSRLVDRFGS